MADIGIGSRVRKSPFYDSAVAAGATAFTIYNAMYMPVSYGDPTGEYQRLTTGVSVWDVAAERQVEISGPDAFALSNYLSARDLTGMKVGRARYAPICDHEGRLINDPVILRVGEDRYWFSIADSKLLLWARAIGGERYSNCEVMEPDVSPLAIQGPDAQALVGDLFGHELVDGMGFFHHCPVELDGIPIVLCKSGWSKQGGFELFLTDGSQGARLWNLVMEAGQKYRIAPGTPNHLERIESGLLSFGSDHDADTDPIEAGLGAYTSLDDGREFVGSDVVSRSASYRMRSGRPSSMHGSAWPSWQAPTMPLAPSSSCISPTDKAWPPRSTTSPSAPSKRPSATFGVRHRMLQPNILTRWPKSPAARLEE